LIDHSFITMAAIAAQPDLQALSQHLIAVSHQLALIPNMPVFDIAAMLAHMNQQHAAIQGQLAGVIAQQAQHHEAVMQRFEVLEASHARLPLQLRNAAASLEAPVLYPHGLDIIPGFPVTKRGLLDLTGK
jgi:hypothetical protein